MTLKFHQSVLRNERARFTSRSHARAALLVGLLLGFVPPAFGQSAAPEATVSDANSTDPYALLDQMGEALQVIENEYYQAADQQVLLDGAVRGMVSGLDPHSAYFNREDRKIFEGSTSGKFGGIGVEVEFQEGEIIVIAPIEDSPAERAGILPGDRIVAINGVPLLDAKPHDVVSQMRGEIGSSLRLTLRSLEKKNLRDVVLVREQIAVSSVLAQSMQGGILYLRIKAFQENTHQEFLKAISTARKAHGSPQGIILDLRNNPGGLVRQAAALADEFLNEGTIFSTRHRGQTLHIERAHRGGAFNRGPVVVLINEYSASAAELVAGALKDSGRARVLGATSFGKGSVQTLLPLGHGGALKLTTALYFTPSGQTTQAQGVTPHILVDPGYVKGPTLRVLKESDLKGHLEDVKNKATSKGTAAQPSGATTRGAPPTNEELHLGVARTIPEDPSNSPDLALMRAYRLILGLPNKAPQAALPSSLSPAPTQKPPKGSSNKSGSSG